MADSSTIQDAVNEAAKGSGVEVEEVEVKESKKTETSKEEESSDSQEDSELDTRTQQALDILDQLEDPVKGAAFIKQIATQMGLIEKAETKSETKAATAKLSKIKDKIMSTIGEEYPLMADKLGTVLEEIISETEERFNNTINERESVRLKAEVDSRTNKFIADNKVTEAEQKEIIKLANKFPPHPSISPEDYLTHHLKFVRAEQREKSTKDKIKENLSERPANRGSEGNENIPAAKRNLTPIEAVRMAQRGETLE